MFCLKIWVYFIFFNFKFCFANYDVKLYQRQWFCTKIYFVGPLKGRHSGYIVIDRQTRWERARRLESRSADWYATAAGAAKAVGSSSARTLCGLTSLADMRDLNNKFQLLYWRNTSHARLTYNKVRAAPCRSDITHPESHVAVMRTALWRNPSMPRCMSTMRSSF